MPKKIVKRAFSKTQKSAILYTQRYGRFFFLPTPLKKQKGDTMHEEREDAKEGELYKIAHVFDETFELRYGYYDDIDRNGKYSDPIPIYPDFTATPVYTKEGFRFSTSMQDACEHYSGRADRDSCASCIYFKEGEDLIGLCLCKENMRSANGRSLKYQNKTKNTKQKKEEV